MKQIISRSYNTAIYFWALCCPILLLGLVGGMEEGTHPVSIRFALYMLIVGAAGMALFSVVADFMEHWAGPHIGEVLVRLLIRLAKYLLRHQRLMLWVRRYELLISILSLAWITTCLFLVLVNMRYNPMLYGLLLWLFGIFPPAAMLFLITACRGLRLAELTKTLTTTPTEELTS